MVKGRLNEMQTDEDGRYVKRLKLPNAHVAQSAEHFLGKEEVMGPIPIVGFAQQSTTGSDPVALVDEK